jgi:hypothetical protein
MPTPLTRRGHRWWTSRSRTVQQSPRTRELSPDAPSRTGSGSHCDYVQTSP